MLRQNINLKSFKMKHFKTIMILAIFSLVVSSCTSSTAGDDDKLYEQSIDKKDIKNRDT